MISFRPMYSLFLGAILTVVLVVTVMFGATTSSVQAATLTSQAASWPQLIAMNRAKAVTKNLEGKAQEAVGSVTGDRQDQMMGKAKQAESQFRNAAEDVKDHVHLKGRAKAVAKNVEGKVQEAVGDVTGDRKDQMVGQVKQDESRDRNIVEDVKDKVQNLFN